MLYAINLLFLPLLSFYYYNPIAIFNIKQRGLIDPVFSEIQDRESHYMHNIVFRKVFEQ